MNVVNRMIVIILLLLLIVVTAIVVLVPEDSLQLVSVTSDWLRQGVANYRSGSDKLLFAGASVLIGGFIVFACLAVIYLELRRPRKKAVRVQKLTGGEAQVSVSSIEQRLAYNIDQLPDVVTATPHITGRSRGVDVDLLLETTPDIDIPMKTEEVMEVTRQVIVERMGLKLGKVQVKIKHAPYPKE
jgi:hypothetical protein